MGWVGYPLELQRCPHLPARPQPVGCVQGGASHPGLWAPSLRGPIACSFVKRFILGRIRLFPALCRSPGLSHPSFRGLLLQGEENGLCFSPPLSSSPLSSPSPLWTTTPSSPQSSHCYSATLTFSAVTAPTHPTSPLWSPFGVSFHHSVSPPSPPTSQHKAVWKLLPACGRALFPCVVAESGSTPASGLGQMCGASALRGALVCSPLAGAPGYVREQGGGLPRGEDVRAPAPKVYKRDSWVLPERAED